MGPVLQEILKTGFADGISVPLRSQITIGEGEYVAARPPSPHSLSYQEKTFTMSLRAIGEGASRIAL